MTPTLRALMRMTVMMTSPKPHFLYLCQRRCCIVTVWFKNELPKTIVVTENEDDAIDALGQRYFHHLLPEANFEWNYPILDWSWSFFYEYRSKWIENCSILALKLFFDLNESLNNIYTNCLNLPFCQPNPRSTRPCLWRSPWKWSRRREPSLMDRSTSCSNQIHHKMKTYERVQISFLSLGNGFYYSLTTVGSLEGQPIKVWWNNKDVCDTNSVTQSADLGSAKPWPLCLRMRKTGVNTKMRTSKNMTRVWSICARIDKEMD